MIYKFIKTGNLYKILEDNAEMKDPTTRNWIKCVIYQSLETDKIYVREIQDFNKKFEIWKER